MSRVQDYFLAEAAECLEALRSGGPQPADPGPLYTAARRLRGNAQLARYGAVAELAGRLEDRLKRAIRAEEPWTDAIAASVADEIEELAGSVDAVRTGRVQQDARSEAPAGGTVTPATGEVAIEAMEYTGHDALRRALELRTALEDGIVSNDPVGPILDELFDLIRLGTR